MNVVAIIDDSDINLALLKALVGKLGNCQAHAFAESAAGFAWCAENLPDLIIVDYMMPIMDGIEFITRLRRLPERSELPILMITANDDREVRYRALEVGATDFLTKPVDRMEFAARARNLLALNTTRKHLADRAAWLAEEVAKATSVIHEREQELLFRMSRAAEFRDPETGAHIQRMAHFSRLIAAGMGLSAEEQLLILQAAPMHDVGKIGIPDAILLKPGRLTPEEFAIMRGHSRLGFELLAGSQSKVLQAAASIALAHHERFDGSGYPAGLAGSAIPLDGRIVAVADVFDALVSERPYKRAWELERAFAYLESNASAHFDPECVKVFLARKDEVLAIRLRFQDEAPDDF
ncbi:MAG TPA: response regulator [Accumulibacter sp.]|uniref:HD-GYP domain-containing protein n=1 Tax=Accumulibacter sp. TaxID=2053492 RepID=UPI002BB307D5|nr:HD domain-containing phosphohydrolase [Accumulibacter sp.]HMV04661.1 response regulator [Accumulibacter sp.]HMX69830.1 response regulator [Accumulibacter sp.]